MRDEHVRALWEMILESKVPLTCSQALHSHHVQGKRTNNIEMMKDIKKARTESGDGSGVASHTEKPMQVRIGKCICEDTVPT